jgi:hypothetical protein
MSLHTPPAVVERLRAQAAALHVELDLLGQERWSRRAAMSDRSASTPRRQGWSSLPTRTCAQEAKWHDELAAVQQIHALRVSEGASEEEAGCAGGTFAFGAAASPSSERCFRSQQEAPLIFPQVDEQVVAAIVADWTGIPVGRMVQDEVAAVFSLQARLDERVIGQGHASQRLPSAFRLRGLTSFRPRQTGGRIPVGWAVGRRQDRNRAGAGGSNVRRGAEPHHHQHERVPGAAHRVDLKGAPPGYVGYGEGGVLTEAVRRPYSVILLDEVEKGPPRCPRNFLPGVRQGLDGGRRREAHRLQEHHHPADEQHGLELIANLCEDQKACPTSMCFGSDCSRSCAPSSRLRSWGALSSCPICRWGSTPWKTSSSLHLAAWSAHENAARHRTWLHARPGGRHHRALRHPRNRRAPPDRVHRAEGCCLCCRGSGSTPCRSANDHPYVRRRSGPRQRQPRFARRRRHRLPHRIRLTFPAAAVRFSVRPVQVPTSFSREFS